MKFNTVFRFPYLIVRHGKRAILDDLRWTILKTSLMRVFQPDQRGRKNGNPIVFSRYIG